MKLLEGQVTIRDLVGATTTAIVMVWFCANYFQSKSEAAADKKYLIELVTESEERQNKKFDEVKDQFNEFSRDVKEVVKTTNYIKGRLEPGR